MADHAFTTLDGGTTRVGQGAVDALAASIAGELLTPDSEGFDEARSLWNAMIDRRPGLIVECAAAEDVPHVVRFARENGLLVSVCGAGHNIAGTAVSEGGLMISFKKMGAVVVDADSRTVRVEPGATLGNVDAATQEHALAVPTGINSTTGNRRSDLGRGLRLAQPQVRYDGR